MKWCMVAAMAVSFLCGSMAFAQEDNLDLDALLGDVGAPTEQAAEAVAPAAEVPAEAVAAPAEETAAPAWMDQQRVLADEAQTSLLGMVALEHGARVDVGAPPDAARLGS